MEARYMKFRPRRVNVRTGCEGTTMTFRCHGRTDDDNPFPLANRYFIKFRVRGTEEWEIAEPEEINFTVRPAGLQGGTIYEVVSVSTLTDDLGEESARTESAPFIRLTAEAPIPRTAEDASSKPFLNKFANSTTTNTENVDPSVKPWQDDPYREPTLTPAHHWTQRLPVSSSKPFELYLIPRIE